MVVQAEIKVLITDLRLSLDHARKTEAQARLDQDVLIKEINRIQTLCKHPNSVYRELDPKLWSPANVRIWMHRACEDCGQKTRISRTEVPQEEVFIL